MQINGGVILSNNFSKLTRWMKSRRETLTHSWESLNGHSSHSEIGLDNIQQTTQLETTGSLRSNQWWKTYQIVSEYV